MKKSVVRQYSPYDNANRRSTLTLPNGVEMSYGYDNGSELTGITYTNGGTTLGTLTYGYDLAGWRTSLGGSYAQTGLPMPISSASYNANNQLTQWGTAALYYDLNGNMTSDGSNSYAWSARNQLASMNFGSNSFQYDGYGRRTGRTISSTTTNYLYDGANPVQELSGTTPTANILGGLGIDEVFTRTDSTTTANFLTDALGSTVVLTDPSVSTLAAYAYEPFGNTTVTSGSSANPYEYTGRENDGTGLQFNRARYYSPTLQRFVSEDPLGLGGGVNFYAYTEGSPIDFRDPFGTDKKGGGGGNRFVTLLRRIGDYIPVPCGAGVFNYYGPRLSGDVASVGVYHIQSADSRTGYGEGTFTDITVGEILQGGYGYASYDHSDGDEHFGFGGLGGDIGILSLGGSAYGSHVAGDSFLHNQIGINLDAGLPGLGGGVGIGINTDSLTSCVDNNFH
jgi:RHS repeat-associated protein